MDIEQFCVAINDLKLSQAKLGTAVLWFFDRQTSGTSRTPGEISKVLKNNGLVDNPHSTNLGKAMVKLGHVQKSGKSKLRMKPTARSVVASWVKTAVDAPQPVAEQELGYLPKSVWAGTVYYVERIAEQINSTFQFGSYDATAVLCRRLMETLLIEAFEKLGKEEEIKNGNDDYKMLGDVIAKARSGVLRLGRDSKRFLPAIKELGDRSAHNRRYTANEADLLDSKPKVRLVIEELIQIAELKRD